LAGFDLAVPVVRGIWLESRSFPAMDGSFCLGHFRPASRPFCSR